MLTDEEIAFLRARLDEDEATAKAATPGPWCWEATGDKDSSWAAGLVQDEDGNPLTGEIAKGEGVIIDGVCESIDGNPADGAHIARHDPARVLREVAVWRRILLDYSTAPLDATYGGTERETGFRLALSAVLKAKIATYEGNPVTGEPFPAARG